MKYRYLYVEVRAWFEVLLVPETETPLPLRQQTMLTDDPISFDSIEVDAIDDTAAYSIGREALDVRRLNTPDTTGHMKGSHFLNDYVVRIS